MYSSKRLLLRAEGVRQRGFLSRRAIGTPIPHVGKEFSMGKETSRAMFSK
jgi:hypothetical protein